MINIFKNKPFLIFFITASAFLVIIIGIESIGYHMLAKERKSWLKNTSSGINLEDKAINDLQKKNEKLVKQIKQISPKGIYIIVDTAKNTLYLKKDNEVIRKAVIATGKGTVLTELGGKKRSWTFDTPRGEFAVKYKLKDPKWVAPDWDYLEKGEEMPKKLGDRVEEDVLGEYAMGFGNGYFLHGTLYTRLQGRNVTHGCVRLGDEDLEFVNKASTIGTKIYIF
jgi:L,D-transpeptidase ErfK/SrfK